MSTQKGVLTVTPTTTRTIMVASIVFVTTKTVTASLVTLLHAGVLQFARIKRFDTSISLVDRASTLTDTIFVAPMSLVAAPTDFFVIQGDPDTKALLTSKYPSKPHSTRLATT